MTAPRAAQLPLPTGTMTPEPAPQAAGPGAAHRPAGRPPRSRRPAGALAGIAAVLLLAATATGCVTVDGASAVIPATTAADARAALAAFVHTTDQANTRLDVRLNAQAESGALGAIDGASITARHAEDPSGGAGYRPLVLSDTHVLIPRQSGWPKWFLVDTAENRDNGRWLLVFTHDTASEPWRASYLLQFAADRDPRFATDQQGYLLPVPGGTGLAAAPDGLAAAYAAYLQHGSQGSDVFADGPYTSQAREQRSAQFPNNSQAVTQFADEAADTSQYPTIAVRLADGGALVFFTSQTQIRQTVAHGPLNVTNALIKALLTGTPNTSVTLYETAEQAVVVPVSGKVAFLDQIQSVVSAHGS